MDLICPSVWEGNKSIYQGMTIDSEIHDKY